MGSAFWAERDAGGRAGEDHARANVKAVNQCVESTADEGIVDRADRDQVLARQLVRKSKLPKGHKEIHFGDTEFNVLSGRAGCHLSMR